MTKAEYSRFLKTPQWQQKRKEILKRDKYTCTKCKAKGIELHVHHRYYVKEKKPWQYPNSCFRTLCKTCHQRVHFDKPISSFFKERIPTKLIQKKKKRKFGRLTKKV